MRLRDYVLLAELDLDDTNTDATQDRRPGDDGFMENVGVLGRSWVDFG